MLSKPRVLVSPSDYERLHDLLDTLPRSDGTDHLYQELERADIVPSKTRLEGVVRMHSKVQFTVISTGKTFSCTLVYPHEVVADDTLSVLTPAGSALLGLSAGQEIEWPVAGRRSMVVRIDAVFED